MTKKLLNEMVLASYNKGELDAKKISEFASYLNRKELKQYIRGLKEQEKKQTVIIDVPTQSMEQSTQELKSLFPNKKVVFKTDPNLLLGMRITDNDNVYEMNLHDSLQRLINYIAES